MAVTIASGSQLKKIRTFIRPNGTLTTPEEALGRNIRFSPRVSAERKAEETEETAKKAS